MQPTNAEDTASLVPAGESVVLAEVASDVPVDVLKVASGMRGGKLATPGGDADTVNVVVSEAGNNGHAEASADSILEAATSSGVMSDVAGGGYAEFAVEAHSVSADAATDPEDNFTLVKSKKERRSKTVPEAKPQPHTGYRHRPAQHAAAAYAHTNSIPRETRPQTCTGDRRRPAPRAATGYRHRPAQHAATACAALQSIAKPIAVDGDGNAKVLELPCPAVQRTAGRSSQLQRAATACAAVKSIGKPIAVDGDGSAIVLELPRTAVQHSACKKGSGGRGSINSGVTEGRTLLVPRPTGSSNGFRKGFIGTWSDNSGVYEGARTLLVPRPRGNNNGFERLGSGIGGARQVNMLLIPMLMCTCVVVCVFAAMALLDAVMHDTMHRPGPPSSSY